MIFFLVAGFGYFGAFIEAVWPWRCADATTVFWPSVAGAMSWTVFGTRTHAHESKFFQPLHALFFSDEFVGSHGFNLSPMLTEITGCVRLTDCCGGMVNCVCTAFTFATGCGPRRSGWLSGTGCATDFLVLTSAETARPVAVRLVIFWVASLLAYYDTHV